MVHHRNQLLLESSHSLQFLLLCVLVKQWDHPSLEELLFTLLVIPVARQKEESPE